MEHLIHVFNCFSLFLCAYFLHKKQDIPFCKKTVHIILATIFLYLFFTYLPFGDDGYAPMFLGCGYGILLQRTRSTAFKNERDAALRANYTASTSLILRLRSFDFESCSPLQFERTYISILEAYVFTRWFDVVDSDPEYVRDFYAEYISEKFGGKLFYTWCKSDEKKMVRELAIFREEMFSDLRDKRNAIK